MGKLRVEICIISARGLRRSSSLWRLQWFAVGWVHPSSKYCTRIDASRNANPVWRTKFAAPADDSEDLALNVEVYSREPIFLRERLQGTATVRLREFLSERSSGTGEEGEVGSYQLRKRGSDKPQGFVDVSIRVSEGSEANGEPFSLLGNEREDSNNGKSTTLANEDGPTKAFPTEIPLASFHREPELSINTNPMPRPRNYPMASGPSYGPPRAPLPMSPPPPPERLPDTYYINMPSSSSSSSVGPAPARGMRPGLAMGLGAGALAAGAVIFGDDFMSGLGDPTVVVSSDPPF